MHTIDAYISRSGGRVADQPDPPGPHAGGRPRLISPRCIRTVIWATGTVGYPGAGSALNRRGEIVHHRGRLTPVSPGSTCCASDSVYRRNSTFVGRREDTTPGSLPPTSCGAWDHQGFTPQLPDSRDLSA